MDEFYFFMKIVLSVEALALAGYLIWGFSSHHSELKVNQFDPEIHLRRHDLEEHVDLLSFASESKSQKWSKGTTGFAYNCGYLQALMDIDKYLKGHASDSFTDKNKHDV